MLKGGEWASGEGRGYCEGKGASERGQGQTTDPPRVRRLSEPGESCAALSTPLPFSPLTSPLLSPCLDRRPRVAASLAIRGLQGFANTGLGEESMIAVYREAAHLGDGPFLIEGVITFFVILNGGRTLKEYKSLE